MKVTNHTIDLILSGAIIFHKSDPDGHAFGELLRHLAEDLKEARDKPRQIVRTPLVVLSAGVLSTTKVESKMDLQLVVAEPYASVLAARAEHAAKALSAEPYPLVLVPRMGLWLLQLNDMRSAQIEQLTAVCRAESFDELTAFIARERAPEPYTDGKWSKRFRKGGPLEWFNPPLGNDCFVNVAENMDDYMARAFASLRDAKELR